MFYVRDVVYNIGVDLAGLLGDAWRAPKVGRCRVGWGMGRGGRYGEGCPLPSRLGGLGSVVSSSSARGPG